MSSRSCVLLCRSVRSWCSAPCVRGYAHQNSRTLKLTCPKLTYNSTFLAKPTSPIINVKQFSPVLSHQCCFVTDKEPEKKVSLYERLKLMYKDYWYVLVPVHVTTSALWYGGFYYLIVSGVDIASIMEYCGTPDSWVQSIKSSKAGAFVAAYTLYKLATPARYTVTLGGTTVSINYLKKWGWIKPMPNREQLKLMYNERKDAFKDLKTTYQDKMQVTKDEIKDEFIKTADEVRQHYTEAKEGLQRSMVETKHDLKQGVKEAAREWTHVGGLVKKTTTNIVQDSYKIGNKKEK